MTFKDHDTLPVKGERIELIHTGGAHTPGDMLVWLPQRSIVIAGDTVFVQRLPGVIPGSALRWIKSLEYLRNAVSKRFADGAFDPVEASQGLDQSRLRYLVNYDDLGFRSRNAQAVADEVFQTLPQ